MKTIFRSTTLLLILAAIIAFGAVAGMAQDPCTDVEGQNKMQDEFDELYKDKVNLDVRSKAIDSGKAFLEKYGSCESAKVRADWLKVQIPKMETNLGIARAAAAENALVGRFVNALTAKNFDEVFASGKEALSKYPDKYRSFSIVLGSIGFDEAYKGNNKYSDDALRFAKAAIADLEAGKEFTLFDKANKPFTSYGFGAYTYRTKEDALGYMNLTIGYITSVSQKNQSGSLPYLYKTTQGTSEASKNPIAYELIGNYYFAELNKIVEQIAALSASQNKPGITPEELQKIVDEIKGKVAMSNGISERAMDSFARAYTNGQAPAYKAKMKKNVEDAYNVRFGKREGVDAWIMTAIAKPFVNPTTPIEPIKDPEPVAPVAQPTTPPVTGPATTGKPPVTTQAKPAATSVKNPAKPSASVKKKTTKKKTV
jgi:predicted negative regulator of RcsB-dependent stress response